MHFNKHYDLVGKHSFLSPSKYTWLGYSKDQLFSSYSNAMAAARGTKLHAMAKDLIDEGIKLRGNSQTFSAYVNDAIDLKTGTAPAHMEQLEIYAALFLMEYEKVFGVTPKNTKVNLRIYQNDDIEEASPDSDRLEEIILDIREKDQWLEEFHSEVD